MEVTKKLQPGENGTKRFVRQYGDRLVCVRYRADPRTRRGYTTIELIVDERFLPGGNNEAAESLYPHPNRHVYVRIGKEEIEVRNLVKRNSGIWVPDKKLWKLPYQKAVSLGIRSRIVPQ